MNKFNIGCGKHILPADQGWINVDRIPNPGVNVTMDVFRFPWEFADNTADEFQLSHIVEHIPHEASPSKLTQQPEWKALWEKMSGYDGFFWFFEEIWRIGVNGAKVHVTCPYGLTYGAFQDPTHTRYMVPQSFAYLTDEMNVENGDFDYKIPCLYTVDEVRFDQAEAGQFHEESIFMATIDHLWNTTRNMYVELTVIK